VQVPDEESFARDVSECVNLELGESACPLDKLVGLDDVVEKSLEIVMEGLCDETSNTHRVPPFAITRLARGGKTTALGKLFDAIKKKTLNEEKVNVMIISFNGHGNFERVKRETQADSIIRNIVRQLVPDVNQKKIICAAKELDKYIGDKPFVLLIDELNKIRNPVGGDNEQSRNPVDQDAKCLLQQLFLGKKNRYLVFTSHYRINIDPLAADDMVSESDPGVKSISLPVSTDLETLRKMPQCGSINAATVALYGGIPSLIYSVFALNELTPYMRFAAAGLNAQLINDGVNMILLLKQFVKAVITGERNQNLKMFDQFAITTDGNMQWPICYIKCILGLFEQTDVTRFILAECDKLVVQASSTESGKDWECIIDIALGFRCLYQQFYGSESPFDIVPLTVKPNVFAITLPDDVQSIITAKKCISKFYNASFPALVLATPTYSKFPIVDGFVAYFDTKKALICGYQAKLGEGLPKMNFGKKQGIDRGIILQGDAPGNSNDYKGWEHWNKEKVQKLLGYSLKDLYPADWQSFNLLGTAAAEEIVPSKNKKIKLTK
jgi:hypothetical protein